MRMLSTCVQALTAALLLLLPAAEAQATWPYAHANSANNGYVGVMTAPGGRRIGFGAQHRHLRARRRPGHRG